MIAGSFCPLPSTGYDAAFARALDVDAIHDAVRRSLLVEASLVRLQPRYVRWKGRHGSLLGFAADIVFEGESHQTFVTVRTAAAERLASEYERIAHRSERVHLGLRGCALMAERGMLLLAYPIDRIVRELRHLVRASKVRGLVLEHCPDWLPVGLRITKKHSRGTPISYKPERRAVVRWDVGLMDEAGVLVGTSPIWLRVHAAATAARARAATELAAVAGVRVPRALAMPHERLLIEAHVPGRVWRPGDGDGEDAARLGAMLARLHGADVGSAGGFDRERLPLHDTVAELDQVLRCADDLRRIDARLGDRAVRLADALSAAVPPMSASVLSHGDLHPGQVLFGEQAALVDFDRACRAPRAHDLATLRASLQLSLGGERGEVLWSHVAGAYDAVLPARHRPSADELRWWTAAALLRRSVAPFRCLMSDWPFAIAAALDAAQRLLDAVAGSSARAGEVAAATASSSVALRLPRLPAGGELILRHAEAAPATATVRVAGERPRVFELARTDEPVECFVEQDGALSSQLRCLEPAAFAEHLPEGLAKVVSCRLVAWRPGRRAVVAVRHQDAMTSWWKLLDMRSFDRAERVFDALGASASPLQLQVPVARLAAQRAYVAAAAPGSSLRDLLASPARAALDWDALAAAVRALAATPLRAPLPRIDFEQVRAATLGMLEKGMVQRPELGQLLPAIAVLPAPPASDCDGLVHGDLHDKQLFVGEQGFAVIDLEGCGVGDARFDLANLVEHVRLRALQGGTGDDGGAAALLSAHGGGADPGLDAFRLLVRARLCGVYALRPRWRELVTKLAGEVGGQLEVLS